MLFHQNSYAQHARHFERDLVDEERIKISTTWFDESTADYWRHARAYECAECLNRHPDATWLTVGDGRWGLDSIRIRKKGFGSVLPTDIGGALLEVSKQRGYIDEYSVENAEQLSFKDQQFDYVFCKESFHHFPRPYVALYEMLRVAKRATFLIEPNDTYTVGPVSSNSLRAALNLMLGRRSAVPQLIFNPPSWEESGNYAYTISRREAQKVAYGLNLPQLAIKGLNDHYVKGCEFEPADLERSAVFRKIVSTIQEKDRLCREGLGNYNMLMIGFFICPMDAEDKEIFTRRGWEVIDLPRNPHTQELK
ncbi:MAG: methyltransferase domain-containing protein [Nitrospira sp.]|nr:methyltransferase domain-containing protein [Nitrospira sp.]MDH5317626.1 methyltransferase domain-containing protein [Nitrospira sp.]